MLSKISTFFFLLLFSISGIEIFHYFTFGFCRFHFCLLRSNSLQFLCVDHSFGTSDPLVLSFCSDITKSPSQSLKEKIENPWIARCSIATQTNLRKFLTVRLETLLFVFVLITEQNSPFHIPFVPNIDELCTSFTHFCDYVKRMTTKETKQNVNNIHSHSCTICAMDNFLLSNNSLFYFIFTYVNIWNYETKKIAFFAEEDRFQWRSVSTANLYEHMQCNNKT